MFSSRIQLLGVASLLVSLAACASSPSATSGAGDPGTAAAPAAAQPATAANEIRITVNQNKFDAGRMAIWVAGDVGVPMMMGEMEAGETKTFVHKITGAGRRIQLSARSASGSEVRSDFLNVPPNASATWDIQLNSLRIRR
jgi:hypothetical protein